MDFIKQMRGFRKQRLLNPIAANSVCLYLILFEYDNDLGFLDWFTAPNSTLQGLTGLSLKAIQRARNELVQKGYIQYRAGKGSSSGKYQLCDLTVDFVQQNVPQPVQQMSNNMSESASNNVSGNMSTLNNLTKLNLNKIPPKSPKGETDIFAEYDFSEAMKAKLSEWLKYKQEKRQGYKPTGLKQFLRRIDSALQSYEESDILAEIGNSMANNWQGIQFDRLERRKKVDGWKTGARNHEQTDGGTDFRIPGITEL